MTWETDLTALRELANQNGWRTISEKEIQHGYQIRFSDGQAEVGVNFYKTGRALIQGQASPMKSELDRWWQARSPQEKQTRHQAPPAQLSGIAHIGSDEVGKGDYYGGIVVAAVFVTPETEKKLLDAGVKDSKKLSDKRIKELAKQIRMTCPFAIVNHLPDAYNAAYDANRNSNILLAEAHIQAIAQLAQEHQAEKAIVDQFPSADKLIKVQELPLEFRTHGESDIAVAAGAILARVTFLEQVHNLALITGQPLPLGASNPQIIQIGRKVVAEKGSAVLRKIAKVHFRTTEAVLSVK